MSILYFSSIEGILVRTDTDEGPEKRVDVLGLVSDGQLHGGPHSRPHQGRR